MDKTLLRNSNQPIQRLLLIGAVVIIMIATLALIASIEPRYKDLSTIVELSSYEFYRGQPTVEMTLALESIGWSLQIWATYFTLIETVMGIVAIAVALFIIWQKPNNWYTVFLAVSLVMCNIGAAFNVYTLQLFHSEWQPVVKLLIIFAYIGVGSHFVLFPNGRFVPRWTRFVGIVWVFYVIVTELFATEWGLPRTPNVDDLQDLIRIFIPLCLFSFGISFQIYRYFWCSTYVEKQQTKWVVFSLLWLTIVFVFLILINLLTSNTTIEPPNTEDRLVTVIVIISIVYITITFLPIAIAIAILRHRLWDIDLLINRTFVYGSLTAFIILLYVAVVGGLSVVFNTQQDAIGGLLATGMVALLFQPVKERLQRGVDRMLYGDRDDPATVLTRLAHHLDNVDTPKEILPNLVQTIASTLKVPYVAICDVDIHCAQPIVTFGKSTPYTLQLSLRYQDEIIGYLEVAQRSPHEHFKPDEEALLVTIATFTATTLRAVQLSDEVRESRQRIVTAREEERRRIRRDLHDGLGPQLASQTLGLEAISQLMVSNPDKAQELLEALKIQAQEAIMDVRRLVYDLRPPSLDDFGLIGALRQTANRYESNGLQFDFDIADNLPELPAAVETAIFRIAQEAMTNVVRHAQATRCTIRLDCCTKQLVLEICDNGRGLGDDIQAGIGIQSMAERTAELNGIYEINSLPVGGTRVQAQFPLEAYYD